MPSSHTSKRVVSTEPARDSTPPEPWQLAWRAIAPFLPREGLQLLLDALTVNHDSVRRLYPYPWICDAGVGKGEDDPPVNAEAICYALWQGHGLRTVRQVHQAYDSVCGQAREEARVFDLWYRFVPWPEVRARMVEELGRMLG